MLYFAICLCHLPFFSSVFYNFLSKDLLLPQVGLFQHIYIVFVMENVIISLISVSELLLLVWRNARHFCTLILCPTTLSNLLIKSSSFLMMSFRFYMFRKFADPCHLQTVTVLLHLFQIVFLLFLFLL